MAKRGSRDLSQSAPDYDDLRERASAFGLATLTDTEALRLFLDRSLQRGARTWAEVLIGRWGSLNRVLAADVAELAEVVGSQAAVDLKLVHDATLRVIKGQILKREVISSWDAVKAYVRVSLAGRGREQFRVLFLDNRNRLISDEMMGEGTTDHAPVYPREIARRALQLDACAVILVHNHPGGSPSASTSDIKVTQEIVEACRPLRILVHDHLIVADHEVTSFKTLGLIA
ncbi:MAG: DNA repair protein RadC [Phenylobacterium sp.]|uniref:RadC family protein n=1 Tax=Phenylobacterium sp. TaxID=1871053 RepID=UPI003BB67040